MPGTDLLYFAGNQENMPYVATLSNATANNAWMDYSRVQRHR
jgi:hypothetical protein